MWLVTVTVTVSSDVTDVWLSNVVINPNPSSKNRKMKMNWKENENKKMRKS